jgi:hypothetical protein
MMMGASVFQNYYGISRDDYNNKIVPNYQDLPRFNNDFPRNSSGQVGFYVAQQFNAGNVKNDGKSNNGAVDIDGTNIGVRFVYVGGISGYTEALYLINTVTSLYNEYAKINLGALEQRATELYKFMNSVPKSLKTAIQSEKFIVTLTNSVSRKIVGVAAVTSAVSIYQDPSWNNVAINVLDNAVGIAAFIPGMQIPALIYFTARISYDLFEAYSNP